MDEGVNSFTFDEAFGPNTSQQQLFEAVALPMVQGNIALGMLQ